MAAGDFVFRHGDQNVVNIDYTPTSGDVLEGEGVLLGNTAGLTMAIAPRPITNNTLGALSVGGVWEATIAAAYAVGTTVYKPAGNAILTTTSTNNALFGFLVEASTGVNSTAKVLHHPFVN